MIAEARSCSEQLAFGLRTIQGAIRDLTPEQLAFVPPGLANSIATLVLKPRPIVPAAETTRPASTTGLRPRWSAIRPDSSSTAALPAAAALATARR